MIFDTHAHVLSPDRDRYPFGPLRGGQIAPVAPVTFPVEELARQMDLCGVTYAALVQRATLYGYDNRYTLDAAAQFGDKLAPIVVLDAQEDDTSDTLIQLASAHKLAGLRLVAPSLTQHDTDWLESAPVQYLLATASDLPLPVTVILYRRNNEAGRAALARMARQFPDLPFLVDHVGLPHPSTPELKYARSQGWDYSIPTEADFGVAEYLSELGQLPNVHFKVTDINFDRLLDEGLDLAQFLRVLADSFGADRLVWGSDVGQSSAPYSQKVARLRQSAQLLDSEERAAFFSGTAMGLYAHALGEQ